MCLYIGRYRYIDIPIPIYVKIYKITPTYTVVLYIY